MCLPTMTIRSPYWWPSYFQEKNNLIKNIAYTLRNNNTYHNNSYPIYNTQHALEKWDERFCYMNSLVAA